MIYWKEYRGHDLDIMGKKKMFDKNIYTFDIETTSYIILNGKQMKAIEYLDLTKKEQEECIFMSCMYIWMFSINDKVYYGRTWQDLYDFFEKIEIFTYSKNVTKKSSL
jgi:hypothetical protein